MESSEDQFLVNEETAVSTIELSSLPKQPAKYKVILEPVVLLVYFATSLSATIYENEVIYQTCTNIFGYNVTDCKALGTGDSTHKSKKIEAQVQEYATKILMTKAVVGGFLPAISGIIIGPCSDKFGRKPVILIALAGYCLVHIILSVITFISSTITINPWILVIPWIPISISGGETSLNTGIFSYVADITENTDRPIRMALLEATIFLGYVGGTLASSFVLKATDATYVFTISSLALGVAIIYTIFFIKESLNRDQLETNLVVSEVFSCKFILDTFKTCVKERPKFNRMVIWLIVMAIMFEVFAYQGSDSVFYLFVREKFGWTIEHFTVYDSGEMLLQVFGNLAGMYVFKKLLGISVTTIALIGFGSSVMDCVIKSAAKHPWHLYLAVGFASLESVKVPMCHTILSSVIPPEEVGRIFSLATSLESISNVASAPIYASVYRSTISIYPGAFNVIGVGMYFLGYLLVAIVFALERSGDIERLN